MLLTFKQNVLGGEWNSSCLNNPQRSLVTPAVRTPCSDQSVNFNRGISVLMLMFFYHSNIKTGLPRLKLTNWSEHGVRTAGVTRLLCGLLRHEEFHSPPRYTRFDGAVFLS